MEVKNDFRKHSSRAVFGSKFAAIVTTVGSAVGLGNIWRFPYEAGSHGGGAFMLCYCVFAILICLPVLIAEFILGRSSRSDAVGSYEKYSDKKIWKLAGFISVSASILIMGFYCVVGGWTLEYCIESLFGIVDFSSEEAGHRQFLSMTSGWASVYWAIAFSLCNYLILVRGVTKGIEKMSSFLMPMLFLILLIFCIHSFFLPGFGEGMSFLFHPDFSKINSSTLIGALGQAFFSLSLGMGCMITYSSYFTDQTKLGKTAVTTMVLDSMVALMSGIIIFPAVFSYGFSPAAGPTLVFEVLPNIFYRMVGGGIWSTLFFLLLFVASITSIVSVTEIFISVLVDQKKMSRKKASTVACSIGTVLSILCALSLGPCREIAIGNTSLFDVLDYLASNILMPIGGMMCAVFVGWVVDRRYIKAQLTNGGQHKFPLLKPLVFFLRYICPLAVLLIFLDSSGLLSID